MTFSADEIKRMNSKYVEFEIHYPSYDPHQNGKFFGKTTDFEKALKDAQSINGVLYGFLPEGTRVIILY